MTSADHCCSGEDRSLIKINLRIKAVFAFSAFSFAAKKSLLVTDGWLSFSNMNICEIIMLQT